MTGEQIQNQLAKHGKSVSRVSVFRYLSQFQISPSGAAQRPQQYPEDSVARILLRLGLLQPLPTARRTAAERQAVVTLPELKRARAVAGRGTR